MSISYLPFFKEIEFRLPPGAHPADDFLPVQVRSNSFEEITVLRNDVLYANVAHRPGEGQLSACETMQGILLGFYFTQPDGSYRIENVCRCPGCPPQIVQPSSVISLGPITHFLRYQGNCSFVTPFKKFREALWET
jgi:hypothetical protein